VASLDYLIQRVQKPLLIECDTSNPDVWKAYKEEVPSELVNLDEADGWIQLVNICDGKRENAVVINTAARNNNAVARFGQTLDTTLGELDRKLVSLWVVNRQRDSLELLKEFMEAMASALVHVVRNAYFGEERKFELYNESKLREVVEGKGGRSVTFPDLADRVSDDLYTKRMSLGCAAKKLPLGNRAELMRWRGEVRKTLEQVVA
jgi:hypothetical protein